MREKVWISGPIPLGDRVCHFSEALKTYRELISLGYAPLMPQLSMLVEFFLPGTSHEAWLEVDVPWCVSADAVLLLPGESRGAEKEIREAGARGVPVVRSVGELLEKVPPGGE